MLIFIFGALGFFKLGALLEGWRQMMPYELAPHVSVEQIGDFCNPNPVQNFHWVFWSDPNPVDLSKYFIQSGLNPKKPLAFYCSDQCSLDIHIWSGWVFFEIQSNPDPVLNCRNRLDGDPQTKSCSTLLHVLVTFTEQVVPIQRHITSSWIPSISGTKTATMKPTKKAAVKLSDHNPITYLLSTPQLVLPLPMF